MNIVLKQLNTMFPKRQKNIVLSMIQRIGRWSDSTKTSMIPEGEEVTDYIALNTIVSQGGYTPLSGNFGSTYLAIHPCDIEKVDIGDLPTLFDKDLAFFIDQIPKLKQLSKKIHDDIQDILKKHKRFKDWKVTDEKLVPLDVNNAKKGIGFHIDSPKNDLEIPDDRRVVFCYGNVKVYTFQLLKNEGTAQDKQLKATNDTIKIIDNQSLSLRIDNKDKEEMETEESDDENRLQKNRGYNVSHDNVPKVGDGRVTGVLQYVFGNEKNPYSNGNADKQFEKLEKECKYVADIPQHIDECFPDVGVDAFVNTLKRNKTNNKVSKATRDFLFKELNEDKEIQKDSAEYKKMKEKINKVLDGFNRDAQAYMFAIKNGYSSANEMQEKAVEKTKQIENIINQVLDGLQNHTIKWYTPGVESAFNCLEQFKRINKNNGANDTVDKELKETVKGTAKAAGVYMTCYFVGLIDSVPNFVSISVDELQKNFENALATANKE